MKILILILVMFGCSSPKKESTDKLQEKVQQVDPMADLEQTKWLFKVVDGVYNYYEFTSGSNFKYYSAELEDMFYGNYEVNNDTLYVSRNISASDSLLDASSPHRSLRVKQKFVMEKGKLLLVQNEYKHATGWITTEISPNSFYIRED